MKSHLFLAALLSVVGSNAAQERIISIADTQPNDISDIIDSSFPALAFETSSFYDYAIDSDGNPNVFSQNLVDAIFSRTGGAPVIRVGGTSGDFGRYNASQEVPTNRPATEGPPAFHPPFLQIGPSYFEAYKSFPNTQYLFMVPFAHYFLDTEATSQNQTLQNTLDWAAQGLSVIGSNLDALEIGNEPDFYVHKHFNISKYIEDFNSMQIALSEKFPKQLGDKIFQGLDKAYNPPVHAPLSAFMGKVAPGKIKSWAYHYYQQFGKYVDVEILQREIMNHTHTVSAMKPFADIVQHYKDKHDPIRLYMDEVGVSMTPGEGHNNLGTSLSLADYLLHNMAIGITRVHYQQMIQPGFNLWQPVKSKWGEPLVRANFFAMPFAADFIAKGETRVHEVEIPDSDVLSAYTAWEDGRIARIAIVNMDFWEKGQGERRKEQFMIENLEGVKSATIEYLTAPDGALAEKGLTWSGLKWSWESHGKEISLTKDTKTVEVKDGELTVDVDASSAIMITLEHDLDDPTACDGNVKTEIETAVVTKTMTIYD